MTEEKAQIKNHGNIGFRYAKGKDAGLVLEFLKRLSEYEKAEEHLVSTPELLQEELERDNGAKALFVLADGKEVGMALFFRKLFRVSRPGGDFHRRPSGAGRIPGKRLRQSIV